MSSENLLDFRARIKILQVLALNQELSISQIIRMTKLNPANVEDHFNYLKSHKFIQEKIYGRIKIYRYNSEDVKARNLKKIFQIWEEDCEGEDIIELVFNKELIATLSKEIEAKKDSQNEQ